ncbi:MAG: serine hydrolase [Clostridia bacterium]|nr:serine hydrolase [Clostridia bacterium]
MSYKLTINAISHIGDDERSTNEVIYADRITSMSSGVCAPMEMSSKSRGKKHVLSVISGSNAPEAVCNQLDSILDKQNSGNLSIKIQYALKDFMEELCENECSVSPDSSVSMLYIDGQNVYMAGFGDVSIYHYSTKTKSAKKVNFLGNFDESHSEETGSKVTTLTRIPARVKRISALNSGDEYLIVGNNLKKMYTDEQIEEILTQQGENSVDFLTKEAKSLGCRDNLTVVHVVTKKQHSPKLAIIGLIALVVLAAYFVISALSDSDSDSGAKNDSDYEALSGSEQQTGDEDSESDADSSTSSDLAVKPVAGSLQNLVPKLDAVAAEITGSESKVAYYVKNLATGEVIEKNDSKMYSASLIKLYIMAEIYRQADAGELVIDGEIKNLLTQMITVSDNDACNALATKAGGGDQKLGFKKISDNAVALGCNYTVQANDLQAVRPVPIPTGNFTSVRDCGIILEKIYKGELVSPEASAEMLALLKQQQRRGKIPRDLPSGVVVANKTGETSTAQNDVAIVYSEHGPYIICIMINDYANSMDYTMDVIARMSKIAYDYIEG